MRNFWHDLCAHRLSGSRLQDLQAQRLRAIVADSARRVSYYRKLFERTGLQPDEIRSAADLPALPITSKTDLLRAGPAAIADGVDPQRCRKRTTSGSTSPPLPLLFTPDEEARQRLITFRALLLAGLRPADKLAVVSAVGRHETRFYQRLGLFRSCNISRLQTTSAQLRQLQDYRPDALWAYATVVRELLYRIDDQLHRIVQPRLVLTAGEIFDPHLRERLLNTLDAELVELYGSTEVGIVGVGCRQGGGIHVFSDQFVVETTDEVEIDGRRAGRAVVTCLTARAMPMLRYLVGDYFEQLAGPCSCGLAFPRFGRPLGRKEDLIRLPSGRILSPATCNAFLGCRSVQQYRFIHERDGRIRVQIRPRHGPEETRADQLRERIADYLAEPVPLEIEFVENFPEQRIKFRTFVSRFDWS